MTLSTNLISYNRNYNRNINKIGNQTENNFNIANINMYNYYKLNKGIKSPLTNKKNNLCAFKSIDINNNNYNNKLINLGNYNNNDFEEDFNINNKMFKTQPTFYRPNHFMENINQIKVNKKLNKQNLNNDYQFM